MKHLKYILSGTGILVGLLTSSILFNACAIRPNTWSPSTKPAFEGVLSLNERLSKHTKINLLGWNGPESFVADHKGNLYCGVHKGEKDFSQGAILKISSDGRVTEYLQTTGWVTGIAFDSQGDLIALINGKGLVRIDQNKHIHMLADKAPDGQAILMGSGLSIAQDGTIYFANLSSESTTTTKHINKLFLELKPKGGIYAYHPESKKISTLSKGNYFANGLALSKDERFLLVSETSKYRVLRYWLSGPKAGSNEILMDNLPGFPNNIIRRENGNFWLGFTTKRNDQLDKIHPKKGFKKLVYGLPGFMQPKAEPFGMVLEINANGEIIQSLFDPTGANISEAGAVFEWNNHLYLGGDVVPSITKVPL